jgi:hypothetical protein
VRTFALIGSFALVGVDVIVRSIIFAIPTALVAQWCGVPASWKSVAFLMFCCFWYDCVFTGKPDTPKPDAPRKAAATVMTPVEVAAEARKLGRESRPRSDR